MLNEVKHPAQTDDVCLFAPQAGSPRLRARQTPCCRSIPAIRPSLSDFTMLLAQSEKPRGLGQSPKEPSESGFSLLSPCGKPHLNDLG